jgi:hypothetical protein
MHLLDRRQCRPAAFAAAAALFVAFPALAAQVTAVRIGAHPNFTRVVFELDGRAGYQVERGGTDAAPELKITIDATSSARELRANGDVRGVKVDAGTKARAHIALKPGLRVHEMMLADPPRIVIDLHKSETAVAAATKPAPKPKADAKETPAPEPAPKVAVKPEPDVKPTPKVAVKEAAKPEPDVKPAPKVAVNEAAKPEPDVKPAPKETPAPKEATPPAPAPKVVAKEAAKPEPAVKPAPEVKPSPAPDSAVIPEPRVTPPPSAEPARPTPPPAVEPPKPADSEHAATQPLIAPAPPGALPPPPSSEPTPDHVAPAPEPTPAPAPEPRMVLPKPTPAPSQPARPPASGPSWTERFTSDPIWIVGIAAVLLGAAAIVVMRRRRALPNDLDVTAIAEEVEQTSETTASERIPSGGFAMGDDSASSPTAGFAQREAEDFPQRVEGERSPAAPTLSGLFDRPAAPAPVWPAPAPSAKPTPAADAAEDSLFDDAGEPPGEPDAREGDAPMNQEMEIDLPVDRRTSPPAARMGGSAASPDIARMLQDFERRIATLEARLDESNEAREKLERQVAAQSEELRVQRAAIARTQRALRTMTRGDEDKATEPALRDGDTQAKTRVTP